MGFLSKIFGGNGAYKKSIRNLESAKELETTHYLSQVYADPLQDSGTQAALRQARELLAANSKRTAGRTAVAGATEEAAALEKESANQALEDITSGIAATATNKREQAMRDYLGANRAYTQAINNVRTQQAQAESSALGGLLGSGLSAAATIAGGPIGGAIAGKIIKK